MTQPNGIFRPFPPVHALIPLITMTASTRGRSPPVPRQESDDRLPNLLRRRNKFASDKSWLSEAKATLRPATISPVGGGQECVWTPRQQASGLITA
jgi:hypothetical protein